MAKTDKLSIYLSMLLRHHPEKLDLSMDVHGWVPVAELIDRINAQGRYTLTRDLLEQIVRTDSKGRYRFSEDGTRIRACQGHSIPWVEPELTILPPPEYLYHGTTMQALEKIRASGAILRMNRHAVHMQADPALAWTSACRWTNHTPVLLKIAAGDMHRAGVTFGVSDNGVWCTERVPTEYICQTIETAP